MTILNDAKNKFYQILVTKTRLARVLSSAPFWGCGLITSIFDRASYTCTERLLTAGRSLVHSL